MSLPVSRRGFMAALSAFAASTALSRRPAAAQWMTTIDPGFKIPGREAALPANLLYPPMDLSYFDKPIYAAPAEFHLGYAAITWGGNDLQAIDDIAALGFPGIQLRSNVIGEFKTAGELKELLEKRRLDFVALSSK